MSPANDPADKPADETTGGPRPDEPAVRRPEEEPLSPNGSSATSPEEIEAQIRRQRAELAETLDALGTKLDVKSQAQAKAHQVKARATTDTGKPRPEVVGAAVVVVAGVVALVWWRRSR
jgi:hypothetical protein